MTNQLLHLIGKQIKLILAVSLLVVLTQGCSQFKSSMKSSQYDFNSSQQGENNFPDNSFLDRNRDGLPIGTLENKKEMGFKGHLFEVSDSHVFFAGSRSVKVYTRGATAGRFVDEYATPGEAIDVRLCAGFLWVIDVREDNDYLLRLRLDNNRLQFLSESILPEVKTDTVTDDLSGSQCLEDSLYYFGRRATKDGNITTFRPVIVNVDTSVASSPRQEWALQLDGGFYDVHTIERIGNYYISFHQDGFDVHDMTDPQNPITTFTTRGGQETLFGLVNTWMYAISGNLLIVPGSSDGTVQNHVLSIFDISDLDNVQFINSIDIDQSLNEMPDTQKPGQIRYPFIRDNRLYLFRAETLVWFDINGVNLATTQTLQLMGRVPFEYSARFASVGGQTPPKVIGDRIFSFDRTGARDLEPYREFQILPSFARRVEFDPRDEGIGQANYFRYWGGHVFDAGGRQSYRKIDLYNPTNPIVIGETVTSSLRMFTQRRMPLVVDSRGPVYLAEPDFQGIIQYGESINPRPGGGTLAAALNKDEDVLVVAKDPRRFNFGIEVNDTQFIPTRRDPDTGAILFVKDLNIFNNTLLVFWESGPNGISIGNISDPEDPVLVRELTQYTGIRKVGFRDNYVFLAREGDVLDVLDISEPENPVLVKSIAVPTEIAELQTHKDHMFFSDGNRITFVDVSDPKNPKPFHQFASATSFLDFLVLPNSIVLAHGVNGISVHY